MCTVPAFHLTDYGVYGDTAIVPADAVLPRPPGLDAVDGSAVWMAFLTAYGALCETAGMRPGDVVRITAASSSVGLAAIQLANHLGAVPVATTRSPGKAKRLPAEGAAHVVVTGEEDLAERLAAITGAAGGRGVDIAFDAVGGTGVTDLAQVIVPGGQLICYGFLGGQAPLPFATTYPFTLTTRNYEVFALSRDLPRPARAEALVRAGLRLGSFRPVVDRTFALDEIAEAHRYMEAGGQVGKIVVTT